MQASHTPGPVRVAYMTPCTFDVRRKPRELQLGPGPRCWPAQEPETQYPQYHYDINHQQKILC